MGLRLVSLPVVLHRHGRGGFNFIGNLSGATVPAIIGWLARDGDFEPALVFIAIVSVVGSCSDFFLVGKVERIEVPER